MAHGGLDQIVGAEHVGAHRFHRVLLAGRHLLQRRGVEDDLRAAHRFVELGRAAHVADDEAQVRALLVEHAHIVLFLLVAREHAHLARAQFEQAAHDEVAERAGAAGD